MAVPRVCVLYVTRRQGSRREVLLGEKRAGLGQGKVVAPGGKLEPGEQPADAALRELREEVGDRLVVSELRAVGVHQYRFPTKPSWDQDSHVFVAEHRWGEPAPSDELNAFWVPVEAVPYERMWADAALWLPDVLRGGMCGQRFVFAADLSSLAAAS